MSYAVGRAAKVAVPRFKSALKNLSINGVDALKPKLITGEFSNHWKPPLISSRVANVLRKQAVQAGTYGSFDKVNLIGWDSAWDVELAASKSQGQGRIHLRPPNKTSRQRTREKRARKIEATMEDMDGRIEEYYRTKQNAKPAKTFENSYKQQMAVTR
jgi:hypothetical protein